MTVIPLSTHTAHIAERNDITYKQNRFFLLYLTSPDDTVRIFGHITNLNGSAIPQAILDLYDNTGTRLDLIRADNNGFYEFSVPRKNKYNLIVSSLAEKTDFQVFQHIPVSQEIRPGDAAEIETNITLRPGANLILHAYDSSGNLFRIQAFQSISGNQVFVTDLDDQPQYGWFSSLNDTYSRNQGGKWDLTIPAIAVPVQTPVRFHVFWEIPEFGKVILDLDNEGAGYQIEDQGDYLVLNFNYEAAKSQLAALRQDYETASEQGYPLTVDVQNGIQSSETHLNNAETFLSQTPVLMENVVSELNLTLRDALITHEELVLQKAKYDIEQNRKGSVRLQVLDSEGNPIPAATVSFQQTSHDFLFGAQPIGNKENRYLASYAALLREAGLNSAYISADWGKLEASPGIFDWTWMDRDQNVPALLDQGFKVDGGLAFWLFRENASVYDNTPKYQDSMSFSDLQSNAYEHMRTLAYRYRGRIDLWGINEQNLPQTNVLNLTWDQKIVLAHSAIAGMKAGNPDASTLFVSAALPYEYYVEKLEDPATYAGGIAFKDYLNLAASRDISIDVIGLEFYYAGVDILGNPRPGLSLASLSRLLDQYSGFDKPIYVEEFSAPSTQQLGSNWWHRPWDEATQAEFLEDFYTIAFSKPLVQSIAWSYGISDDECFIQSGGLLDSNGTPKPAYFALKNLITSWTTNGTGTTNENGELVISGFAGDYQLQITDGARVASFTVRISEREEKPAVLTIPKATSTLSQTPMAISTDTQFSHQSGQDWTRISIVLAILVAVGLVLGIGYMINRRK